MNDYKAIIERLKTAQRNYNCGDYKSIDEADEEYTQAWDAAGVIREAAEEAEVTNNNVESARLWAMLAPYDDKANDRMEHMFVVLAFERIHGTLEQRREKQEIR
jgi:predicted S18 family serine protease